MTPAFRRATENDIEAEHTVFCHAEGGLRRGHGHDWVDPPLRWFAPIAQHLLATDPDHCWVAEVDGRIAGFGSAFVRGDTWFLAALFIEPEQQGKRLGRQLFELAARGAPPRQITITDAIQPISNAMYARNGLIPTTPILQLEGKPSAMAPADLQPDRPRPDELASLDVQGYGFRRDVDHHFWSRQRRCTLWRRDGAPVAYAYRSLTGSIGPLVGRDPASAADALQAELASTARATVIVPGAARTLVRVAIGAGLRLIPPAGNLLLSDGVPAPDRVAISGYFLY